MTFCKDYEGANATDLPGEQHNAYLQGSVVVLVHPSHQR